MASEADQKTPAKQRGGRRATPGRKATRSAVKPDADAAVPAEHPAAQPASQPATASQLPTHQEESDGESQQLQQDVSRKAKTPAPAQSNVTQNTARLSGRLGSRLTGTHAALPTRSTASQSQRYHEQEAEDIGGEPEVSFRRPQQPPMMSMCHDMAQAIKQQAQDAYRELHAGRITPQLAAAVTSLLLLWLLSSTVGGWRQASNTAQSVDQLTSALQSSQQRLQQLETQLSSTRSHQDGQESREQELRQHIQELRQQLQESQQATQQLQYQHQQQQSHWKTVVEDLQSQHSAQQQQWERDLAQLQVEVGSFSASSTLQAAAAAAASGDEEAANKHWTLIRQNIFFHMRQVLDSFAADRTGKADYALASAGGKVVGHSLLAAEGQPRWAPLLHRSTRHLPPPLAFLHPSADQYVLSPSGLPGRCLALNGTSGHVDIRLRTAIKPEAVTIEHVPRSIAFDTSSAPQHVTVFGYQGRPSAATNGTHLLGLQYDRKKSPIQTFQIKDGPAAYFDHVRFQIVTNQGNSKFTCLYRVRVHGQPQKAI